MKVKALQLGHELHLFWQASTVVCIINLRRDSWFAEQSCKRFGAVPLVAGLGGHVGAEEIVHEESYSREKNKRRADIYMIRRLHEGSKGAFSRVCEVLTTVSLVVDESRIQFKRPGGVPSFADPCPGAFAAIPRLRAGAIVTVALTTTVVFCGGQNGEIIFGESRRY